MGSGGAARTLLNILNNIDRDKFTPILVTLNYNGDYEHSVKSDVKFIKLDTQRLRKAIFPLANVIRKEKVDIVFSTIPNYNTIAILANLFSFTKAKNVVREADNLGGSFSTNLKLMAYGLIYKLSSQIVSLSEGVKENLVKRYKIKPKNIEVIYNPVDLENIQNNIENEQLAREHVHLFQGNEKVIVTAGRLVKQKDHHTLLNAFAKVRNQMNSRLVILGEGELEADLKKQAKELNIENSVDFIGFQRNPYIYFNHADLFVLSSIHEGFGHVLAEALATGTPVVSTNCKSGPAEVLNDGEYGRLCEVGNEQEMADKMLDVLMLDETKRTHVIEQGYKRAHDFNATKIVKDYEALFTKTSKVVK